MASRKVNGKVKGSIGVGENYFSVSVKNGYIYDEKWRIIAKNGVNIFVTIINTFVLLVLHQVLMCFDPLIVIFSDLLTDFAEKTGFRVLDCSNIGGTECWCDGDARAELEARIAAYPAAGIHWIDTGDYHYMTRLWTARLGVPFSLLLLDHHPDVQAPSFGIMAEVDDPLLSCGSWAREVLEKDPFLQDFTMVGIDPALASEVEGLKVHCYTEEDLLQLPEPVFSNPVYVSLDLDVLRPEDARTNWDQGSMTLQQLKTYLEAVFARNRVLGVDICGGITAAKGGHAEDFRINAELRNNIIELLLKIK